MCILPPIAFMLVEPDKYCAVWLLYVTDENIRKNTVLRPVLSVCVGGLNGRSLPLSGHEVSLDHQRRCSMPMPHSPQQQPIAVPKRRTTTSAAPAWQGGTWTPTLLKVRLLNGDASAGGVLLVQRWCEIFNVRKFLPSDFCIWWQTSCALTAQGGGAGGGKHSALCLRRVAVGPMPQSWSACVPPEDSRTVLRGSGARRSNPAISIHCTPPLDLLPCSFP